MEDTVGLFLVRVACVVGGFGLAAIVWAHIKYPRHKDTFHDWDEDEEDWPVPQDS